MVRGDSECSMVLHELLTVGIVKARSCEYPERVGREGFDNTHTAHTHTFTQTCRMSFLSDFVIWFSEFSVLLFAEPQCFCGHK